MKRDIFFHLCPLKQNKNNSVRKNHLIYRVNDNTTSLISFDILSLIHLSISIMAYCFDQQSLYCFYQQYVQYLMRKKILTTHTVQG